MKTYPRALLSCFGSTALTPRAQEAGNTQLADPAQLEHATRERRAIITANVVDFIELAREAVATNTEHGGIVLVPSSFRETSSRRSLTRSSKP